MREFQYTSKRAKYERKVFIIFSVLKKIALFSALISIIIFWLSAFNVLGEDCNTIIMISGCFPIISFIIFLIAYIYYADASDYSYYVEKKNKKWLI